MNKMLNVIRRKLKEQSRTAMFYAIGLFAYAWMIIAIFPMMEEFDFEMYIESFPEEMMTLLGAGDIEAMNTIEGFLAIEYLAIFFILILTFFVASSAGTTIAGAIEKKTIDFQLSQPISRIKMLLSEAIVTIIYTIGLVVFNSVVMILLGKLHNVDISLKGVLAFTILATGMMLSIYGISILLSSIMKSRAVVMTSTIFLILAMHIFQSLTMIVDKLQDFEQTTLFYMYKPEVVLSTGDIDHNHILVFFLVFTVGLLSSIIIFNKKEIA